MYTLTSSSLGGKSVSPDEASRVLRDGTLEEAQKLVDSGALLPLAFEGDGMLDGAAIVVGDLTEEEQREWVGRIRTRLSVPCGKLVLMGCGTELDDYNPERSEAYQVIDLPPGDYDVALLFNVGSYRADEFLVADMEALQHWFDDTCAGKPIPAWFQAAQEGGIAESLVSYLVHISPALEPAQHAQVQALKHRGNFVDVDQTELRRPQHFPMGIDRSTWALDAEQL